MSRWRDVTGHVTGELSGRAAGLAATAGKVGQQLQQQVRLGLEPLLPDPPVTAFDVVAPLAGPGAQRAAAPVPPSTSTDAVLVASSLTGAAVSGELLLGSPVKHLRDGRHLTLTAMARAAQPSQLLAVLVVEVQQPGRVEKAVDTAVDATSTAAFVPLLLTSPALALVDLAGGVSEPTPVPLAVVLPDGTPVWWPAPGPDRSRLLVLHGPAGELGVVRMHTGRSGLGRQVEVVDVTGALLPSGDAVAVMHWLRSTAALTGDSVLSRLPLLTGRHAHRVSLSELVPTSQAELATVASLLMTRFKVRGSR